MSTTIDDIPPVYPLINKIEYNKNNNDETATVKLIDKNTNNGKLFDNSSNPVEPKDKFKLLYIIFLLHGMAILLPWNIFMNAVTYYTDFKLNTPISKDAYYRENFLFLISIIGQVSNVIMNAMNMVCRSGNPKGRMPYAIMLCALVLIFTVIMAIVDSSGWPLAFFIITCVSIVINFLATGIYNTSLFYVASMFPMQYINAIIFGNNISGIFATLMNMLSIASSPNPRIAAIYFFLAGVVLLLTCFVLYFLTPRLKFYRYHVEMHKKRSEEEAAKSSNSNAQTEPALRQYIVILKKNWLLLLCIWLTMFSTLAIFPVFQSKIIPVDKNFIISNQLWFMMILCFLTFNIFVTIGNFLTEFIRKPGPKYIFIPVLLKAVLSIVFIALCNYEPTKRNYIPVLIKNDYVYWIGSIIYPLISGYLISLLMMYAPNNVEPKYAGTASMLSALTLVIGVVTGIQFSRVLEIIVLL